ncbi:SprT family zinc-dependent metalloprotease [Halorubellus sp. PRR65]|uniref:M48 family metallopeptidase n=1 Tax=Halorubellus sp. PRR65 TaxID=3098148 RepID=UPI002B25B1D7|nr:SprT family zinc-dependent metalloprotease [Halorubellus sp. PRR65]
MRQYHIGQTVVPYEIEWSPDRSTIGLSMDGTMELAVRAPVDATLDDVEAVLEEKQQWILEKLYGLAEQDDPPLDKEYLSGEKLLYNGRRYRLKVASSDVSEPKLEFDGSQFNLTVPEHDHVSTRRKQQAVVDWYIRRAEEELPERANDYIDKLGLDEVEIDIRPLRRSWGEYQSGRIALHWRLILAPRKIQDYVVAHELAHFKHGDHSDSFWNTVGTLVPDYRERREWLRVKGGTLTV